MDMPEKPDLTGIDVSKIDSVVLRRLIEEVRDGQLTHGPHAYDRVYSRHNR